MRVPVLSVINAAGDQARLQEGRVAASFLSRHSFRDEIVSSAILNDQVAARFIAGIDDLVFYTRRNYQLATRRQ